MKLLKSIFLVNHNETRWHHIVLWWEIRRLFFNLWIFLSGASLLGLIALISPHGIITFYPGPVLVLGFYSALILYFLGANLLYTSGWVCHLIFRKVELKHIPSLIKISFIFGLVISTTLTFMPILFFILNSSLGLIFNSLNGLML